ncbi:MAG: thioredoxin domain-containing protein [Patescibacteria group bacterium]
MHHYRVLILTLAVFLVALMGGWMIVNAIRISKDRFMTGLPTADIQKSLLPRSIELAKMRPPAFRTEDPHRYGSATSVASVIEFGDFECDTCKDTREVIEAVVPAFGGRVRFVWRDLPISDVNPNAKDAAIFARCAGRQGKFWEAHDALFDSPALGERAYAVIAEVLGLHRAALASCRTDPVVGAAIDADVDAARSDGVSSAPFFFIGTQAIRGSVTAEELEREIKRFLSS